MNPPLHILVLSEFVIHYREHISSWEGTAIINLAQAAQGNKQWWKMLSFLVVGNTVQYLTFSISVTLLISLQKIQM